jgi:flavin reductase (DIM6/NTAB) family NADH-FMN oxidoreductase RutF
MGMKRVEAAKVYRLFYPAVPVVVAASHKGKTSAMPAISVLSLSNDPALVGISSSPSHATHETVVRAKSMSVSWLDSRYTKVVEALGSYSGGGIVDKLEAAGLHYDLGGSPEVPIIREAAAHLVCRLARVQRFGDHNLLVGEVKEARATGDFRDYWTFRLYHPILYRGIGRPSTDVPQRVRRP